MQPSRIGAASMTVGQNAHLTFRANAAAGRHGWLRLTPACSYRLVAEALAGTEPGARVLDPFSGSGTTGLLAVEAGLDAVLVDVNPFLVWLATVKTCRYDDRDLTDARERARGVLAAAGTLAGRAGLWQPPIHRIDRWWSPPALEALKALRAALDDHPDGGPATDLLLVAFCRTLIAVSGAAFDHQSMSFKAAGPARVADVLDRYRLEADQVVADAARFGAPGAPVRPGATASLHEPRTPDAAGATASLHEPRTLVAGRAVVRLGDARSLAGLVDRPVEVLFTSPPYANRVSYVRELRPYMYWLRFMDAATQAGELDWSAIGGTWGVATSRLAEWTPVDPVPLDGSFPGGRVVYVVGNSTFFGHQVPTQEWYAQLLAQAGFTGVGVATLRKRNSKAALYEYALTSSPPWKDGDCSTRPVGPVGSRIVAVANPKKAHRAATPCPGAVSTTCNPATPSLALARRPDATSGPRPSRCTAFLPGLQAGASCGETR